MLLPGKSIQSRQIYDIAFLSLKLERDFEFEPLKILVDFEITLHQSIQLHFPRTLIRGCYFHFNHAVWR